MEAIVLRLGVMADRLVAQLRAQGLKSKAADRMAWQKDADAITRLLMRSLMPEKAATRAREKLMRRIEKGVWRT